MRRLIPLAALALAGCAQDKGEIAFQRDLSADVPKTGIEEQALIGNLFQAYTHACPAEVGKQSEKAAPAAQHGVRRSRKHEAAMAAAASVEAAPANDPTQACMFRTDATAIEKTNVLNYLDAGFTLSDYFCETFFRRANKSARERHHQRGAFGSVGTVMGTILSLSHAGAIATGVNTAGFGAIDREFQNFDDSYMVAPDISNLRQLVLAAQDHMRQTSFNDPPKSLFGAESTILRYANLCSFLGMQDLLTKSVQDTAHTIDKDAQSKKDKGTGDTDAPATPSKPAPVAHTPKKKKKIAHPDHAAHMAPPASKLLMEKLPIDSLLIVPPPPTTR